MSEVNGPKISVNQMGYVGIQRQGNENSAPQEEATSVQITDFSNSKAEALGRSMLFRGVDDVNNDLKALLENPDIAENSDKIFETSYSAALTSGIENPYEEAASASTTAM